jgi:hypothetical protein
MKILVLHGVPELTELLSPNTLIGFGADGWQETEE